jgi:Domain of unknown function (DUF4388)
MASTQPLRPPRTPLLRLLSPTTSHLDAAALRAAPVFDLQSPPAGEATRVRQPDVYLTPFSFDDLVDHRPADDLDPYGGYAPAPDYVEPAGPEAGQLIHRQTGYLSGVSLSAVLQMLHLERKTCVVEVSARGWLGSLTLVNGELVDAAVGEVCGEEAACTILNWSNAKSSIIDGVDLFRHTVQKPITSLIMDAVRIGDETGVLDPSRVGDDFEDTPTDRADWQWLVDSLILTGANTARVVTAGASENRQTGFLVDPSADLARGIRTWASLLGPDVSEVVVTRSDHIAILAMLDPGHTQLIYAEASGPETAELIRRAVRSVTVRQR